MFYRKNTLVVRLTPGAWTAAQIARLDEYRHENGSPMRKRHTPPPLFADLDPRANAIDLVRSILENKCGATPDHRASFNYSYGAYDVSVRLRPEDAQTIAHLVAEFTIRDSEIASAQDDETLSTRGKD